MLQAKRGVTLEPEFTVYRIYNEKDEICSFLIENDVDIVLGSKTHLSPSINNDEILPPMYSSDIRDRADGWVGVIMKKLRSTKSVKW